MKNEIQVLDDRYILGKKVRTYGDIENPLFLARDVAEWIEHSNARMMLKSIDDEEKVCVNNPYASSGQQEQWFLTEDGLYEVLMQSRKPIAKEFKKKVKNMLKDLRMNRVNLYQDMSPELKAIFVIDKKQQEMGVKVDYLYNHMTIDYEQQENLNQLAKSRAVDLLGGKKSQAYKRMSKKLFSELWRDYKSYFEVNSYKNTARKEYENAREYLINWCPSTNLRIEIEAINSQISFVE
ncbi:MULTISPECIES: ORF6C domain-containing protein [Bacillota]|uniref:ORF6C domain-containing protein n=1 Tax=Bacillota TaxID=1239 RepID=UPI002570A801|nr:MULTISPECIES: ORF6C domain-containing protein [Bacillota]